MMEEKADSLKDLIKKRDKSRITVCSIALNHLPADQAFPIIKEAGYQKLDAHEKVHLQIFPDLCDPEALKAIAHENGLHIANLGTYVGGGLLGRSVAYADHGWVVANPERFTSCGFSSDDPDELKTEFEQFQYTIDIAVLFGSYSIRIVPGNDQPDTIDKIVPWFKRAAEYAAEKNIYMAFENHGDGIAGTPKYSVEFVEKVGSPYLGVLYEPANLMHDTGTDYRAALETMKDCIIHCHCKDCGPVDGGYEMQHFGEGAIDFPWIIDRLDKIGYEGDIGLEYELHHPEPEAGIKKFYNDFVALFDN